MIKLVLRAPWYLFGLAALGLTFLAWQDYAKSQARAEAFAAAITQPAPEIVDLATVAPGTQGSLARPVTGEIALSGVMGDGYWTVSKTGKGLDSKGIVAEIYADDSGFAARDPRGVVLFDTEAEYEAFMQASVQGKTEGDHYQVAFWGMTGGFERLKDLAISAVESEGKKLPADMLLLRPELEDRATVMGKLVSNPGDFYIALLALAIGLAVVALVKFLSARKNAAQPVI